MWMSALEKLFFLRSIMRWLLVGYCWLGLINISVAQSSKLKVIQKPRFYGVRLGLKAKFYCLPLNTNLNGTVTWYKVNKYDDIPEKGREIQMGDRFKVNPTKLVEIGFLYIDDLHLEDRGVYFCKYNDTWGPGSELQVARSVNKRQAQYRTKMKDGLIILQGLLLSMFVAAVLLRKQKLLEKKDVEYEEPETDHIYEGLTIETCGGGLYEELTVYSQPEGTEAPWE
uniref:B-cell antigen receptor complex-associated protein beta chain n=1 Tax=Scatophagus argus TaxID=75038 RepID=UPI001ED7DFB8|nr:B-cell antigen receptor complex-associated protein beta chain [Scatophagus argus]